MYSLDAQVEDGVPLSWHLCFQQVQCIGDRIRRYLVVARSRVFLLDRNQPLESLQHHSFRYDFSNKLRGVVDLPKVIACIVKQVLWLKYEDVCE